MLNIYLRDADTEFTIARKPRKIRSVLWNSPSLYTRHLTALSGKRVVKRARYHNRGPSRVTQAISVTRRLTPLHAKCPSQISLPQLIKKSCDDGIDASIASPFLASLVENRWIGTIETITPLFLQVSLNSETKEQHFRFSSRWTVPMIIWHISPGQLALTNILFLITDD